jgi:hypothetical protein
MFLMSHFIYKIILNANQPAIRVEQSSNQSTIQPASNQSAIQPTYQPANQPETPSASHSARQSAS